MLQTAKSTGRLRRHFYRNGPQYRHGDVSFSDIRREFGFRAIHIGRWVTQQEQQIAANLIYDALHDLAAILQIPPQTLSLRQTLSLAFGTGGQPGMQAHYEVNRQVLAMAKNAGGGALAHEWFHAFDHYICKKFLVAPKAKFASHAWLLQSNMIVHDLNQRLASVYAEMFLSQDGQSASELFLKSRLVDESLQQVYYALPEEIAARCFEACIQDAKIKNAFLVSGSKKSQEAELGLFPSNIHRNRISALFLQYFGLLGQLIKP
ncbi:CLCA_X family protein [Catenovulum sediminis]|uniref:CLCA_X family protein n=1 Tax=Catenovulum sediminis TaxID=1740262 RepID=A0ABV1RBQ5_9ALTE